VLTNSRQKDCDTTWLYGPLHKRTPTAFLAVASIDSNCRSKLTRSVSYADMDVKPILKQRRICDILLKRSSSAVSVSLESSLPSLASGRSSPSSSSSRKCVRFHDEVEQFIAVNTARETEGVTSFATGESAVEEDGLDAVGSTAVYVQPPSKVCIQIVAKLPSSTLKHAGEVNSLSAAVQGLQDSLAYDHFVLPRFEYEEYTSIANGDDDDEWELSMIGMDFKSPARPISVVHY